MEVDDDGARRCTRARPRRSARRSLSGIANRYVSLKPGPNNADEIADGGSIGADETSAPVDLDTLFNTLDAKTRAGLRELHPRVRHAVRGARARRPAQSIKYFAPFLGSTSRLTQRAGARPAGARAVREGRRRHGLRDRRAPRRPHGPREQHQHGDAGDRRRERGAPARARAAPGHAAQGQHDLREPAQRRSTTSTSWSTSRSRTRRSWRRSSRRCARSCTTRARRSPTCAS